MPRYAIKHTATGRILELDYCGDSTGIFYNESECFQTYGNKQEAEAAFTNMQNSKKLVYEYDHENNTEVTYLVSEFELVEL